MNLYEKILHAHYYHSQESIFDVNFLNHNLRINTTYYFNQNRYQAIIDNILKSHLKGKILDVGAAVGTNSLLLQKQYDVTAVEESIILCNIMKDRNIKQIIQCNIFNTNKIKDKYDTILLCMNGLGILEKLEYAEERIFTLFSYLNKNGQIIFDSKLKYSNINEQFTYQYKKIKSDTYNLLVLDFENIKKIINRLQLKLNIIYLDETYFYGVITQS